MAKESGDSNAPEGKPKGGAISGPGSLTGKEPPSRKVVHTSILLAIVSLIGTLGAISIALFTPKGVNLKIPKVLELSVTPGGAVTLRSDQSESGTKEVSLFLLAASSDWYNSGIILKPGAHATIQATGQVNTAVHHLVDAANGNKIQTYDWSTSQGIPFMGEHSEEDGNDPRIALTNIGVPLVCLVPVNNDTSLVPSLAGNPKPKLPIFGVTGATVITNESTIDCRLYFIVNDLTFSPNDKVQVAQLKKHFEKAITDEANRSGHPLSPEQVTAAVDKNWDDLRGRSGVRRIYYDDNIGSYLITVQLPEITSAK